MCFLVLTFFPCLCTLFEVPPASIFPLAQQSRGKSELLIVSHSYSVTSLVRTYDLIATLQSSFGLVRELVFGNGYLVVCGDEELPANNICRCFLLRPILLCQLDRFFKSSDYCYFVILFITGSERKSAWISCPDLQLSE